MNLVGFIIRNLSRRRVTWTSNYINDIYERGLETFAFVTTVLLKFHEPSGKWRLCPWVKSSWRRLTGRYSTTTQTWMASFFSFLIQKRSTTPASTVKPIVTKCENPPQSRHPKTPMYRTFIRSQLYQVGQEADWLISCNANVQFSHSSVTSSFTEADEPITFPRTHFQLTAMQNKSVAVTYPFKYNLRLTSKFKANFNIILTPWSPQVASSLQGSQLKFCMHFSHHVPPISSPFLLLYLVGSTSVDFVMTSFPSPIP